MESDDAIEVNGKRYSIESGKVFNVPGCVGGKRTTLCMLRDPATKQIIESLADFQVRVQAQWSPTRQQGRRVLRFV